MQVVIKRTHIVTADNEKFRKWWIEESEHDPEDICDVWDYLAECNEEDIEYLIHYCGCKWLTEDYETETEYY